LTTQYESKEPAEGMEGRILVLKKQNDIFPAVMSLTNSTPVGLLKGYSEHSGFKKKNV
jgi:hypothetical protein